MASRVNYSVMVLGADGQPQAQAVEVGLVTSTTAEIKTGLTEGEAVVTGTASAQTGTGNPTGGFGVPGGGPIIREGGNFPRGGNGGGNGN